MKNLLTKSFTYALTALGLGVLIVSCSTTDPAVPAPVADFTSVVDGLSVTFTNTSTNGDSFTWDFGDGETSTEKSPSHTYAKFAGYVVKLTATNASGSNDKSAALEVVAKITIDGDFSDWASIPATSTISATNDFELMAVTMIKATSDLTNIYIYVEGTSQLGGFISMYVNSDADTTTGWANKEHVFNANGTATETMAGGDHEIDLGGPWPGTPDFASEIWGWVDDPGNIDRADWFFDDLISEGPEKFIMPMKTGNAYEFAIVRANWPGGLPDVFSFKFVDVDISNTTGVDWVETGTLPNPGEGYIAIELFK